MLCYEPLINEISRFTIRLMEQEQTPDTENVVYMDEYPHLADRLRLRRMGQLTLFESEMGNTVLNLYELPEGSPPDGAA